MLIKTLPCLPSMGCGCSRRAALRTGTSASIKRVRARFSRKGSKFFLGLGRVLTRPRVVSWGNRVVLSSTSQVFTVQTNALLGKGVPQGPARIPLSLPVVTGLPQFPQPETTNQDRRIPPFQTHELEAGRYGDLVVAHGATLTLGGGLYECASVQVEEGASLVMAAATDLRIAHRLSVAAKGRIDSAAEANLAAGEMRILVMGINGSAGALFERPHAASFGSHTSIRANVSVPQGTLALGSQSRVHGALLGKWVIVGPRSVVTLEGGFGLKVREGEGHDPEAKDANNDEDADALTLSQGIGEAGAASDLPLVATPAQGAVPLTVSFEARSSTRGLAYRWEFGDEQTSPELRPTHTYEQPGVYRTRLVVTQPDGVRNDDGGAHDYGLPRRRHPSAL